MTSSLSSLSTIKHESLVIAVEKQRLRRAPASVSDHLKMDIVWRDGGCRPFAFPFPEALENLQMSVWLRHFFAKEFLGQITCHFDATPFVLLGSVFLPFVVGPKWIVITTIQSLDDDYSMMLLT